MPRLTLDDEPWSKPSAILRQEKIDDKPGPRSMPIRIVYLTGPRQAGKTTLARAIAGGKS